MIAKCAMQYLIKQLLASLTDVTVLEELHVHLFKNYARAAGEGLH